MLFSIWWNVLANYDFQGREIDGCWRICIVIYTVISKIQLIVSQIVFIHWFFFVVFVIFLYFALRLYKLWCTTQVICHKVANKYFRVTSRWVRVYLALQAAVIIWDHIGVKNCVVSVRKCLVVGSLIHLIPANCLVIWWRHYMEQFSTVLTPCPITWGPVMWICWCFICC